MATSKKAPVADTSTTPPAVPSKSVAKPKGAAKKVVPAAGVPAAPVAKKAVVKAVAKAPAKVALKAPAVAKPKAKAAAKKVGKVEGPAIDQAQRANYIEVAAYYIAQRRGFTPGDPEQDYLNAAAEVDQLIAAGHFSK